jgi:chaperonin cofactor prefoldin
MEREESEGILVYRLARSTTALCASIPFLLFASPLVSGQTATPASASQAQNSQVTTPATQPAAKVWTNDDVSGLRNSSALSSIGQTGKSKNPAPKATTANAKSNRTSSYQNQIARLQAQLPPIDSQIADLQAALSGNMVNEQRKYFGVKLDDWQVQLAQLQKRRDDIQNQIAKLEDEARHNGVPNNALP